MVVIIRLRNMQVDFLVAKFIGIKSPAEDRNDPKKFEKNWSLIGKPNAVSGKRFVASILPT
jgi:hypothetical protein